MYEKLSKQRTLKGMCDVMYTNVAIGDNRTVKMEKLRYTESKYHRLLSLRLQK